MNASMISSHFLCGIRLVLGILHVAIFERLALFGQLGQLGRELFDVFLVFLVLGRRSGWPW